MIRPAASTSFYCATIFPPMLPAKKSGAGAVSVKDFSSEAMLVLSARQGEAILLPEAAITFCFLLKRRLRVRLVGSGVANVRGYTLVKTPARNVRQVDHTVRRVLVTIVCCVLNVMIASEVSE